MNTRLVSMLSAVAAISLQAAAARAGEVSNRVKTNRFDTTRGFITVHDLSTSYRGNLGPEFVKDVTRLGPKGKWVDMGAGRGRAIVEALDQGLRFQALGVGYAHPDPAALREDLQTHPTYRYLEGDLFAHTLEQLGGRGQVDLITDVFGPAAYASDLERVLTLYGSLLKEGGKLYLMHNFDVPNAGNNTLVDREGRALHYASFFGNIKGLRVIEDHHSAAGPRLVFERTAEALEVPKLEDLFNAPDQDMTRHYRLLSDVPTRELPPPERIEGFN